METCSCGEVKMKYRVGDMFLASFGGRGILYELGEPYPLGTERYFIYWTGPDNINKSIEYNQYEIATHINNSRWKHIPVVK